MQKSSIISMINAKKDYKVGKTTVKALRGITVEINEGEFTAIAGPSGSGKTTLLNLIGCLDKPTEGDIAISGKSIIDMSQNQLSDLRKDNIGFIFQTFNLIPVLTASENVGFALSIQGKYSDKEIKEKSYAILKDVGLEGMEERRPNELSGGQQQRVAVARALVKEPLLILADEPTANLDSKTGGEVLDLMKELNEKKNATFIFSTHDKMVMDRAKRLILLHDGEIAQNGKA